MALHTAITDDWHNFKIQMDYEKLNIFIIVDAIVASSLSEEYKLLALDDLLKMYKDEDYYDSVGACCALDSLSDPKFNLSGHHSWGSSDLGGEFWGKVYENL